MFSVFVTIKGHMKLFQVVTNVKRARVATVGKANGKAILKNLGIEREYEGVGNCIIGYPDHTPEAKPRKENWVYYID